LPRSAGQNREKWYRSAGREERSKSSGFKGEPTELQHQDRVEQGGDEEQGQQGREETDSDETQECQLGL